MAAFFFIAPPRTRAFARGHVRHHAGLVYQVSSSEKAIRQMRYPRGWHALLRVRVVIVDAPRDTPVSERRGGMPHHSPTSRSAPVVSKKTVADTHPLSHNPFAALRDRGAPASSSGSPTDEAAPHHSDHASPNPARSIDTAQDTRAAALRSTGKLVVRKERKGHGGKTVTRITGVHTSDADALARDLKRALGTGVRIDDDGALTVQGDLVERVISLLLVRGAARIVRGSD
jgi:translation initiation factor 1